MTRQCATPGCATLTFGEICLGCMQRNAKAHRDDRCCGEPDGEEQSPEPAAATA